MRPQAEWKVRIQIARAVAPISSSRRWRISAAARFVKVIASTSFGLTPQARIRWETRCVRTRVFPDPAPAMTRSGPSVVRTASRWAGFRWASAASASVTDICSMLAMESAHRRRCRNRCDTSSFEPDEPVADGRREVVVVRHEEGRALAGLRAQQACELLLARRIDDTRGLVEHEEIRCRCESGAQPPPLPLAARAVARVPAGLPVQPAGRKRLPGCGERSRERD